VSAPGAAGGRVLATVLFTDMVGSTERASALGDSAWNGLLARHHAIAAESVRRNRGRVVKSLGDGTLAVFGAPSAAIACALELRERARTLGVEIRAGVHAGECDLLPEGDIGGIAVHIAARIAGLAGRGEVLTSATVRDLTVGSAIVLRDRGERTLRGVAGPWRVFAAGGPRGAPRPERL
jgi:class 3 adenylate cyclase